MIVCKDKLNAYYPRPDKGCGLICGSRRIRYYRGFLLVSPKQLSRWRVSQRDRKKRAVKQSLRQKELEFSNLKCDEVL
jgi:hypothetical protein